MTDITVPTINTNDIDAILRQWVAQDGAAVQAGDIIAILETTKASFDLEAPADGILGFGAAEGQRCEFGAVIGRLYGDRESWAQGKTAAAAATTAPAGGLVITAAARRLIDQLGISDQQLLSLGKRVLKESDIQALAQPTPAGLSLSPQQQGIARTVALSRSTVPDAFLLQKIDVTKALGGLIAYQARHGVMVGIADFLVSIVGRLAPKFPWFFGTLDGQLQFHASAAGHVGVTLDIGKGLFVPVVRDAATLTLGEVATRLTGFRMKALRNTFEASDLTGGDISISLNTDEGTLFVQPIILSPQTCMLSLGAVHAELVMDDAGQVTQRRVVHLGLAYDHRAINGFQASAFVRAIKAQLESPDELSH